MENSGIQSELAELRAQLDALRAGREAANKANAPAPETNNEQPEKANGAESVFAELSAPFQDLMEWVDKEFKDARPGKLLAAFALGILVGRLLPR